MVITISKDNEAVKVKETITMIFDDTLLEEYYTYYFKKYPKRSKKPIESPIHPSINKWFILLRPQMNLLKQNWKDFTIWVVERYGYTNLKIDKCQITYKIFNKTKRRFDVDNFTPKFLNDGLVESGMLVDDSYFHLNPITIYGGYSKDKPRMEILIDIF